MPEAAQESATPDEYTKFINEAFIQPIRGVVVVDDEYPTLDKLIQKDLGDTVTNWQSANMRRAQSIIDFCRNEGRRWMLELYDGQLTESPADKGSAHHLNHSDLMILDYHLDPKNPESGEVALSILRQLAGNDHFNLVIVHTKGFEETGGDIERVSREIALGLTTSSDRLEKSTYALRAAVSFLQKWEEDEPDIAEKLGEQLNDDAYLIIREKENPKMVAYVDDREFSGFFHLLDQAPNSIADSGKRAIFSWAIHNLQERLKPRLAPKNLGVVSANWHADGVNWIRTERLFITVISKDYDPQVLPGKLVEALARWAPAPHRLLMSKMRAELDERGVLAEGRVLSDQHLQAGWLCEFLTEDVIQRKWKIRSTVCQHWEGLGGAIQDNVLDFANRLGDHFAKTGREQAISAHLRFRPEDPLHNQQIAVSLNKFACSKAVEGAHLSTGHILRINDVDDLETFWLCLSPACDLVPGQKSTGWPSRLGSFTTFRAVQLFYTNFEQALKNAASGSFLFLEVDGDTKAFRFTPEIPGGGSLNEGEANPKWEDMFVTEQGHFSNDSNNIEIARVSALDGELITSKTSANVVAQLRYEYALNLLQRLGANLSRVGLDFVPFDSANEQHNTTQL